MIEPPRPSPARRRGAAPRTIALLVGLMGAGKTSVGKRLAALLRALRRFRPEIAEAAGMSIPEIFASLGEPAFRDGERRVIARLLGRPADGARDRRRRLRRAAHPGRDRSARHLGLDPRRSRPALGPGARPPRPAAAADRRSARRARRPRPRGARRSTPRPTWWSTAAAAPATRRWRARSSRRSAPTTGPAAAPRRRWRRRRDRDRHRSARRPRLRHPHRPGLLARAGAEIAPLVRRPRVAILTESRVAALHLAALRAGPRRRRHPAAALELEPGEAPRAGRRSSARSSG